MVPRLLIYRDLTVYSDNECPRYIFKSPYYSFVTIGVYSEDIFMSSLNIYSEDFLAISKNCTHHCLKTNKITIEDEHIIALHQLPPNLEFC